MLPAVLLLLSAPGLSGGDVTWTDDVRPILAEHCFACHGPDPGAREAGLRLDVPDGLFGGALAPVVRGDVGASELLHRIEPPEGYEFERMPPTGDGLDADEVATLRAWVEAGAPWEPHWAYAPLLGTEPATVRADGRERSPIDSVVRAALVARGYDLAPDAEPTALVRRVHLDLIGLPPTPAEVARFIVDPSDAAYEALVDELLARPDFGVHWARGWLDAARYADSHGFTIDGGRSIWPWRDWVVDSINGDQPFDAFTIDQLAGDLLPDATRDQRIATGFHRNTQINQEGGAKDEENRIAAVMDRVATTGSVWLGSTVACAQCHTHKFDPLTQTEYFGLYAFFDSTTDGGVSDAPRMLVPRNANERAAAEEWEAARAAATASYLDAWNASAPSFAVWQPQRATGSNGPELRPELDGSYRALGQNPVYSTYVFEGEPSMAGAGALRIEALPDGRPGRSGNGNFVLEHVRVEARTDATHAWRPVELALARADFEQDTRATGGGHYPARGALDGDAGGWAISPRTDTPHAIEFTFAEALPPGPVELRVELRQEFGNRHTLGRFRLALGEPTPATAPLVSDDWRAAWTRLRDVRASSPRLPTTLVLEERSTPRVTHRFDRGSFLEPREVVEPHVPAAFDRFRRTTDTAPPALENRLDLARWLVDDRNALVQRVTVNRWWQQLFGRGLVETENDFGLRGARPSHPELLDWLAAELVRSGWSRKSVLREIVLSTTYRQSARKSSMPASADPANVWLGRQRPLRLSGEALRDAMCSVAGVLDATRGGPPVQPPQPKGVFAFTQSAKTWRPSEGSARFRRSLYTRIWRTAPFPFFQAFDAPTPNVACTRRVRTGGPLQALALANDPVVVELAGPFGELLGAYDDEHDRIQNAYREALGRIASPAERARIREHLALVRASDGDEAVPFALARLVFNLAEFTHRP